jgi:hypothetical protein
MEIKRTTKRGQRQKKTGVCAPDATDEKIGQQESKCSSGKSQDLRRRLKPGAKDSARAEEIEAQDKSGLPLSDARREQMFGPSKMTNRDRDSKTRARQKQRIQEICNKLEELRSQVHIGDGGTQERAAKIKIKERAPWTKHER